MLSRRMVSPIPSRFRSRSLFPFISPLLGGTDTPTLCTSLPLFNTGSQIPLRAAVQGGRIRNDRERSDQGGPGQDQRLLAPTQSDQDAGRRTRGQKGVCVCPSLCIFFSNFLFLLITNTSIFFPSQKEKEDLEEVTSELELADEDEPVRYRIGDTFYALGLARAQSLLETETAEVDAEVGRLEERLAGMREEMGALKAHLYARFGRGINLEG